MPLSFPSHRTRWTALMLDEDLPLERQPGVGRRRAIGLVLNTWEEPIDGWDHWCCCLLVCWQRHLRTPCFSGGVGSCCLPRGLRVLEWLVPSRPLISGAGTTLSRRHPVSNMCNRVVQSYRTWPFHLLYFIHFMPIKPQFGRWLKIHNKNFLQE